MHLIAKLAAIGYMMMDCKDKANARAVIAMDGKQSEVGASNGRSGKSLVGEAFKQVRKTVVINGKNSEMAKDNFLWDEVTEKTRLVFIDDVRAGFDLEFLLPTSRATGRSITKADGAALSRSRGRQRYTSRQTTPSRAMALRSAARPVGDRFQRLL